SESWAERPWTTVSRSFSMMTALTRTSSGTRNERRPLVEEDELLAITDPFECYLVVAQMLGVLLAKFHLADFSAERKISSDQRACSLNIGFSERAKTSNAGMKERSPLFPMATIMFRIRPWYLARFTGERRKAERNSSSLMPAKRRSSGFTKCLRGASSAIVAAAGGSSLERSV